MSTMLSIIGRRALRSPIVMAALRQQQQTSVNLMCSITGSSRTYSPSNLEKKFLVWTGKYKTTEEIPNLINQEVMDKAKNRMRIRLANLMMALTALGCIVMVLSGKHAHDRGDSVTKMNTEWHQEYNKSVEEAAAAAATVKTK